MKQDLKEALPKVRNPPSFTLRKEKNKGGFVKPTPDHLLTDFPGRDTAGSRPGCMAYHQIWTLQPIPVP